MRQRVNKDVISVDTSIIYNYTRRKEWVMLTRFLTQFNYPKCIHFQTTLRLKNGSQGDPIFSAYWLIKN